jgi:hypothetical protein
MNKKVENSTNLVDYINIANTTGMGKWKHGMEPTNYYPFIIYTWKLYDITASIYLTDDELVLDRRSGMSVAKVEVAINDVTLLNRFNRWIDRCNKIANLTKKRLDAERELELALEDMRKESLTSIKLKYPNIEGPLYEQVYYGLQEYWKLDDFHLIFAANSDKVVSVEIVNNAEQHLAKLLS